MPTLVFLEHHAGELQKGSLGVLAKAASLGDVAAVIAGEGAKALAAEAGRFGATKVWVCEDAEVAQPLPQPRVDVLAQVVSDGGYETVLFANSVSTGISRTSRFGTARSSASARRCRTPSTPRWAGRARHGLRSSARARLTQLRQAGLSPRSSRSPRRTGVTRRR
jgi:electron transfer flavoprotein alpha subunit